MMLYNIKFSFQAIRYKKIIIAQFAFFFHKVTEQGIKQSLKLNRQQTITKKNNTLNDVHQSKTSILITEKTLSACASKNKQTG
ncbi:MAG: hypothetical protein MI784_07115 [Cytophagales bacterium]|nr:hypothetical protein [Cytophagales bacterium]